MIKDEFCNMVAGQPANGQYKPAGNHPPKNNSINMQNGKTTESHFAEITVC